MNDSQCCYVLGGLAFTISKKRVCSFSVIRPRQPSPMVRPSSSRIGVTSAAVPVKKACSDVDVVAGDARRSTSARPNSPATWITEAEVIPSAGDLSGFVDGTVLDHEEVFTGAFGHEAVGVERRASS